MRLAGHVARMRREGTRMGRRKSKAENEQNQARFVAAVAVKHMQNQKCGAPVALVSTVLMCMKYAICLEVFLYLEYMFCSLSISDNGR
jgi:hypothetical protein